MPFFFPDRFVPGERFCLKVCSEMVQLQWTKWRFLLVCLKKQISKLQNLWPCNRGWGLSGKQLCGQWIIFYLQSLWKTVSKTTYENKLLRLIFFPCSLKDLSLVKISVPSLLHCLKHRHQMLSWVLGASKPHSSSLALHLLINKRILGTWWPLLLPKGCVPRRQTCAVSWLYRLAWAGAKGLHSVLWGGMEKRPQSLTSNKYGIHWGKAGWVLIH